VTPEALEIIVRARSGKENMDNEVAVVLEDPLGVIVALEADG
jgi:hypothetical protein